jgi:lipoprotein LprG
VRKLILLLVAASLVLSACGGSTSNDEPLRHRLVAAKKSFDDAKYIGFTLTSENLPEGIDALEGASGTGTRAPSFTGKIAVRKGFAFNADLIAVGGKVYAKLPFVGWTTIDPGDYGAPDPAALMNQRTGLSSLLVDTVDARDAGTERSGNTVVTKIEGTLPGRYVHALFSSAALSAFDVQFTVTDEDDLHSVSMTGPFYAGHDDCTYTITLDLSAAPVTVHAPG